MYTFSYINLLCRYVVLFLSFVFPCAWLCFYLFDLFLYYYLKTCVTGFYIIYFCSAFAARICLFISVLVALFFGDFFLLVGVVYIFFMFSKKKKRNIVRTPFCVFVFHKYFCFIRLLCFIVYIFSFGFCDLLYLWFDCVRHCIFFVFICLCARYLFLRVLF